MSHLHILKLLLLVQMHGGTTYDDYGQAMVVKERIYAVCMGISEVILRRGRPVLICCLAHKTLTLTQKDKWETFCASSPYVVYSWWIWSIS